MTGPFSPSARSARRTARRFYGPDVARELKATLFGRPVAEAADAPRAALRSVG